MHMLNALRGGFTVNSILAVALGFSLIITDAYARDDVEIFGQHLVNDDALKRRKPIGFDMEQRQALEQAAAELLSTRNALGPYHPALAQAQSHLARLYAEAGWHEEAIDLYQQALHNRRINRGLYAEAQVPLLREMIDLFRLQGDTEAIKTRMDYLLRIYRADQKPLSVEGLAVTLEWSAVHVAALLAGQGGSDSRRLLNAYNRIEGIRSEVCVQRQWQEAWCERYTLAAISWLYGLSAVIQPLPVIEMSTYHYERQTLATQPRSAGIQDERLHDLVRRADSVGRQLLEEGIAVAPNAQTLKVAAADWAWFHGQSRRAEGLWAGLIASGVDYTQPVPMPSQPALSTLANGVQDWIRVDVTAEISAYGSVKSCTANLVEKRDADVQLTPSLVCRRLRSLRFRPSFDELGQRTTGVYSARLVLRRD